MRAAAFLSRIELRRRWHGLLAVTVLVALAGGVSLTAFAGARRTKSSFQRFTAWSRSGDVLVLGHHLRPADVAAVRAFPQVERVGTLRFLAILRPNGQLFPSGYAVIGALDDVTFRSIGRPRIIDGRAAAPGAADEIVIGEPLARVLHVNVGDSLGIASYNARETKMLTSGTPPGRPTGPRLQLRIVGIGRSPSDLSLQGAAGGDLVFSHAFVERYGSRIGNQYGPDAGILAVQLRHGARDVAPFLDGLNRILPPHSYDIDPVALSNGAVQQSIDVLAIALLVFGAIAAIAGLIAVAMTISRRVAIIGSVYTPVRDLGLRRRLRAVAIAVPVLVAVLVGTGVAVLLAWIASPALPFGVARDAEPHPGLQFDALVLGVGALVILVVLGAIVAIAATRAARLTASPARPRSSRLARFFERNRVPTAVTVGIRMVFQPPQPGATASVWPALAGASVAIVGLIGVGVFSASLRHLVATPAAYGQSWEMTVYDFAHQAPASRPCTPVGTPVASYSAIEAIAHSCAQGVTVDGHSMGAISVTPLRGIMHPTVLGGRLPRSRDEVALGSDTLQTLHRNIGDSITVPSTRGRARYRVVGRVIVPTLSVSDPQAIADGAVFTGAGLDRIADIEGNTTIALTIRLRPGVDKAAAAARVAELAGVAHLDGPFAPTERVETPLEVIRLDQIRRVPAALAVFLAVLGAIAVGHLLVTSVRQQRRSFAVLKSMGFNRRQLMATVACEATTIVSLAILIGVVIGAVAGAVAWRAVARDVGVVPGVSFPVAILVAYALVALVVANVLATLPARTAARTPAAAILRAE